MLDTGTPQPPYSDPWETAYGRFETPAQEVRKFTRRLGKLGAVNWSRDAEIIELFCGRGNGLHALSKLGFTRVEGVDLSPSLIAQYKGPAKLYLADCRQLPFESRSKDIVIVQGGLHHLKTLPEDLRETLSEISRILRDNGRFAAVEPWMTPFLSFVHRVRHQSLGPSVLLSRCGIAQMFDYEGETYAQWLEQPDAIGGLLDEFFSTEICSIQWGKCLYLGRK